MAAACLLLAMKMNKLVPPGAAPADVLDRTWRAGFHREDVDAVLAAVEASVGTRERPTAATFLGVYIKHSPAAGDLTTVHLTTYICERLLTDYSTTVYFKPSELAAAALLIARRSLAQPWTAPFAKITNLSTRDLSHVVEAIEGKLGPGKEGGCSRIVQKYATAPFMEVALITLAFR